MTPQSAVPESVKGSSRAPVSLPCGPSAFHRVLQPLPVMQAAQGMLLN
jgi:hypothetical protein